MSSKSNTNTTKPKRPLTPYNLFYRYKRVKIIEASKSDSNIDKEAVRKLIETTPGLENYPSTMRSTIPPDQLDNIRRTIIRLALDQHLLSKDTSKRRHRKSGNGFKLSFLEMNRLMVATWKTMDDFTKAIFKELAEEAKEEHHRQLAEYNYEAHVAALPVFPFPSETVSAPEVTPALTKPTFGAFVPSQLVSPETSKPALPLDVMPPLPVVSQQFCGPLLGNITRQVTDTSQPGTNPASASLSYPSNVDPSFQLETANKASTMDLPFQLEPEDFPIQPETGVPGADESSSHKRNVSVDDFIQLINALKDD